MGNTRLVVVSLAMVSSFLANTATLAAFLGAVVTAQEVLVTTTLNETYCTTSSNVGDFYHYGATFASKDNKIAAIQYEAMNVTCFEFANGANVTIEAISRDAGPIPCSNLAECQINGDCDENATCVMGSDGGFMCQCTELYEGDGYSCSR